MNQARAVQAAVKSSSLISQAFSTRLKNLKVKQKGFSWFKISHPRSWRMDRIVSISILPMIPVSFFLQDNVSDSFLVLLIVYHMHQGVSSITIDYIHKYPRLRKFGVRFLSFTVFFSFMFMIHLRGQGLIVDFRRIWSIEPHKRNYYEQTSMELKERQIALEKAFLRTL